MKKSDIRDTLKKAGTAALAALILFAGGTAGSYLATRYTVTDAGIVQEANPSGTADAVAPTESDRLNPYVSIVKRSSPAVVNIDVEKMVTQQTMTNPFQGNPFFEDFFGEEFFGQQNRTRKIPRRGKGSGFIVSKDGYILTNNHVVEDADKIKVTLLDGRSFDAEKIGQDPTFDLAVIRIKADGLPVLPLGDSNATEVGERVVAIGNPHGFGNTVTVGIVSAKNRTLQAPGVNFQGFLQTDAAINPGNSGGPLIDMGGSVIGINTAIVPYAQGIGFAIPVNMAKQVMDDLIKHGEVRRGWLGVTVQPLTASLVEAYNIPVKEGSIIAEVQKDSPAEKSGMQRGDVIVSIAGSKITNSEDVVFAVRNHLAGEKVPFELYRDGKKMTVEVTLGYTGSAETSRKTGKAPENEDKQPAQESEHMGITVVQNTPEFAAEHGLSETVGVVVVRVDRNSQGRRLGLRSGDLILEINRSKIETIDDWDKAMGSIKEGGAVGLFIMRGGQTLYISVEQ